MANRFYVNGVQIFGNNEMYENTYNELVRQGGKFTEDGVLPKMQVTDPQALMEAVTKDTAEQIRRFISDDYSQLTDANLLSSSLMPCALRNCLYDRNKVLRANAWERMKWYIEDKRVFTPYLLYTAIADDVDIGTDRTISLSEEGSIVAEMY